MASFTRLFMACSEISTTRRRGLVVLEVVSADWMRLWPDTDRVRHADGCDRVSMVRRRAKKRGGG